MTLAVNDKAIFGAALRQAILDRLYSWNEAQMLRVIRNDLGADLPTHEADALSDEPLRHCFSSTFGATRAGQGVGLDRALRFQKEVRDALPPRLRGL